MKQEILFPCLNTILVPRENVIANTYNPNHVSPDKMNLLKQSILDNGFCFPIATIWDKDIEKHVIIDGFHRRLICEPEWLDIPVCPIVVLPHDIAQRMIATIQFNKARGVHQVDLDAEVIRKLLEQGLSEEEVSEKLGIEIEAVHRYKQLTGIASLFAKAQYSTAWEMVSDGN
jgi:hypothetical protein